MKSVARLFSTAAVLPWFSGMVLVVAGTAPGYAQERSYSTYPMEVQHDVRVPIRDGVRLSADVYRPKDNARHPTIFQLTPYNNNRTGLVDEAWHFVKRGYAYVFTDVRGRYDSEGEFEPFRNDGKDGSDVISWIARQPWSNGRVATRGGSYTGMNQWLIAKEANPHHAALVGYVAPADGFNDLVRFNGVPKLDLIFTWSVGMYGRVNQARDGWNWIEVMRDLPLNTIDATAGRDIPWWRAWMEHGELDEYWAPMQTTGSYEKFDIPSFSVTGWFDGQVPGTVNHYTNAVRTASTPSDHVLIVGPWLHGVNRNRTIGERDYGPEAIIELDKIRDEWLDHYMLGKPRPNRPNVMYFLPVKNEWKTAEVWPIPGTQFTEFYLDSRGKANTLVGDGVLRRGTRGSGPPDELTYDPANPVLTVSSRTSGARSGIAQGSVDNRAVETREDVLVYTSEPLQEGMEITGPVQATIYLSTDVPDTDISVKLLDVYPDGRAHNITHGIARARYRNSYSQPELLTSGEVYGIEVEMFPASNYFEAGHRIRIEVSSSNFPLFGRNLNTARSPDTTSEMRVAHTKIHHRRQHTSYILLPIVPRPIAARRESP